MVAAGVAEKYGAAIRAGVFGVSDGLLASVSLILGMAGAEADPGIVRLAGLAGLFAGAFSMSAGEYVSMKAQLEVLEHALTKEQHLALGTAWTAASASFVTFAMGAAVPLSPWFFAHGRVAIMASLMLTATAAALVGAATGLSSKRPIWFSTLRQVGIGAVAAGVTYALGAALGVHIA